MYAIRTFIVILMGMAHVMYAAHDSMFDVADSKPALIWSTDKKRSTKNYFFLNSSERKYCEMDPEVYKSFQSGFTVDLKGFHVLPRVVISFASKISEREKFDFEIYIDQFLCTDMTIEGYNADGRNLSVILNCKKQRGRTVTILSKNLKVCHLQAFVCSSGTTGEDCDKTCSGNYGVSCSLPCNCRQNTTCNRFSGFCEHGCANSDGQRQKDCYFKSAEMSEKSFYEDISKDATSTTTSSPQRQIDNSCFTFTFTEHPHRNTAWVAYNFTFPIYLLAFEVDFQNCPWNHSTIFRVTVDNRTCLQTVFNPSQRKYACYNHNLYGTSIRLTIKHKQFDGDSQLNKSRDDSNYRGDNDNDDDKVNHERMPRMCHIKLFSCHPGFFGPFCRVPCKCLTLPCHPGTGNCPGGRCVSGYKGSNCGLVDVSKDDNVYVTSDRGTIEDVPSLSTQGPMFYPFPHDNTPRWTAIRSIELSGTYRVNHITVTMATSVAHFVSHVAVYTDVEPTDHESLYDETDTPMVGLPCWNSSAISSGGQTFLLDCTGPAAIVTAVVFGTSPLASDSIRDVQVWTCRDGTFGYRCSQVCNCRSADEVCDKTTGNCSSGCPPTHRGNGCQQEICTEGLCELSCEEGSKSCHRKCDDGWMGEVCDIPCPDGFYGEFCVYKCPHCPKNNSNRMCDPVTGACKTGCGGSDSPECTQRGLVNGNIPISNNPSFSILICISIIACVVALCCFATLLRYTISTCPLRTARYSISTIKSGKTYHTFRSMEEGLRWVVRLERHHNSNETSHIQLRASEKVAIWIMCHDFDELIQRRKNRLATGENPLEMKESPYEMSLIPLSSSELKVLYSEVR